MRDQTFERLTSRQLVGIDRFSPGVLLPVAFLCGALAQWLFYGVPLGVNLALAVIGMLILCWILRPAGARVDALDRWVVPVAVIFAFLPTLRSDRMLLLFDVPAMLVLVGMAAVCFAGVPVTRRALDLLVVLGLVVAGRIVSGGAVLLAALPELGRPLTRRAGGRIASIGIGLALALPFLVVFGALFASADAVFSSALRNAFDPKRWSIGEGSAGRRWRSPVAGSPVASSSSPDARRYPRSRPSSRDCAVSSARRPRRRCSWRSTRCSSFSSACRSPTSSAGWTR